MVKRYVIYNPVDGLFVGEFLGLCFWSKMDSAGQKYAPSYETKEEAQHVASIYAPENADIDGNVRCIEVSETDMVDGIYVDITIAEYEINKEK